MNVKSAKQVISSIYSTGKQITQRSDGGYDFPDESLHFFLLLWKGNVGMGCGLVNGTTTATVSRFRLANGKGVDQKTNITAVASVAVKIPQEWCKKNLFPVDSFSR